MQTSEGAGDLFSTHKCKYLSNPHNTLLVNRKWCQYLKDEAIKKTNITDSYIRLYMKPPSVTFSQLQQLSSWPTLENIMALWWLLRFRGDPFPCLKVFRCKASYIFSTVAALMLMAFIGFAEPSSGI